MKSILPTLLLAASFADAKVHRNPHAEITTDYWKDFVGGMERGADKPGTATLIRDGAAVETGTFADLMPKTRAGDVLRLSLGTHDSCQAEQGGGPVRIEGEGYLKTLLACRDAASSKPGSWLPSNISFKDAEVSDLSIIKLQTTVPKDARVWLISVRTLGPYLVSSSGAPAPRGSHMPRLFGTFGLNAGPSMDSMAATFGTAAGVNTGYVKKVERRLFAGPRAGAFEDFAEEAGERALKGKDIPSKRSAEKALAWLDAAGGILPCCNTKSEYSNSPSEEAMYREMLARASDWLVRRYGLTSSAPDPGSTPAEAAAMAAARADVAAKRPLTALNRLRAVPLPQSPSARAELAKLKDAALDSLKEFTCSVSVAYDEKAVQYGTLSWERLPTFGLADDPTYRWRNASDGKDFLARQLAKRYPLNQIAAGRGDACRISLAVHYDEFKYRKTAVEVKSQVTLQMEETERSRQRRADAARAALDAEFDSALKKMSANSERVRDMWRKTYDYRTRVESNVGGLAVVSYTGDKSGRASAGTLAEAAAADRRAAQARAQAGGAEMVQVEVRDDAEKFWYTKSRTVKATVRLDWAGGGAETAPLESSNEWSDGPCEATYHQKDGGHRFERSNTCAISSVGRKLNGFIAYEVMPFLEPLIVDRWAPAALKRVGELAAGDKASRAEAALMTMAMGSTLSKEASARLAADLGDPDAEKRFKDYLWKLHGD